MRPRLGPLILFLASLAAPTIVAAAPRIAIIIDDLGYQRQLGERAIGLPGPLAFAVLPDAPRAAYLAEVAASQGKEVLLHLPLQAEASSGPEEPSSLTLEMSEREFMTALRRQLAAIPGVSGVNTHRGSLLTRHPGHMDWLMQGLIEHGGLYFVDSYTTASSVALQVAREHGVPAIRRHVFLDPDPSPDSVAREFDRLKTVATRQGYAVGIGHPYPSTIEFLEAFLPGLAADGFELVSISELIGDTGASVPGTTAGK
jgi:polysaccharide deacetylase 2 family uncharacterized protein YibQ